MTNQDKQIETLLCSNNETNIELALQLMKSQNSIFSLEMLEFISHFNINLNKHDYTERLIELLIIDLLASPQLYFQGTHLPNIVKKTNYKEYHLSGLVSLKNSPQNINGNYWIKSGFLKSLKGGPKRVNGNFCANWCGLTHLLGAPEYVGGNMNIVHNLHLLNYVGCPKYIGGNLYVDRNNEFIKESDVRKYCELKGVLKYAGK